MTPRMIIAAASTVAAAGLAFGQEVERVEAIASSDALSQISMYSYREGPKSDLFLRGTPLAGTAQGKARVEYQNGNAEISAQASDLPPPSSLGPYTTYMLWTLTPDGRAASQGVFAGPDGGDGAAKTQSGTSQFALIVTAEPHFAVTMPSTMIVLYNVADDVEAEESKVTTLTERADYTDLGSARLARTSIDGNANPLELVQARYSLAIARAAGARQFAPEAYAAASDKLAAAETALQATRNSQRKAGPALAREAVIAGEDARRAAMLGAAAAATEADRLSAASAATTAANEVARTAAANAAVQSERAASAAASSAASAAETATSVERQRAEARANDSLRDRLNTALPTRSSGRGLVSEIGGVQFATGTADADSTARESLARFAGIVASYPDLRFTIEGHTDTVGELAANDELSMRRAIAVRDYLIGQGVAASHIDVAGLGSSIPIGDNSTADGRARNRRVEIVVVGSAFPASGL